MTVDREVPRSGEVLDGSSSERDRDTNQFLAEVPAGALGPRLVPADDRDVIVWAVATGEKAGLYSSFATEEGAAVARRVASVDPSIEHLTLGVSNEGHILAVAVHKKAGQDVLTSTRLGPEGAYQTGPQILATTPSRIVYSKVVPTALGAVVVWVERAAGTADLYTALIDEKGPRRPHRLIRGITAWQVAEGEGSFTVVTREGLDTPSLQVRQVGDRGETIGAPIEIARNVAGGRDLDVAVTRDRILVAYSDKGPYEARLVGALLDASGNVLRAGFPLTKARGEQALLSVRPDGSGGFRVAWHEPRETRHGRPSVFVGELTAEALPIEPTWALRVARRDALLPLFASQAGGLVALMDFECTGGRMCASSVGRAAVALPQKGPATSKPLLVQGNQPAAMAWDLSCRGDNCRYLSSDGGTPSRVYLGKVDPRMPSPDDLVVRLPARGPVLESHVTLGEVPELSELEGVIWGEEARPLLAWVSYFEPDLPYVIPDQVAPDGRRAPVRARLTTVQPSGEEDALRAETVISYRARSLGGVHLVAPEENRGILVWSALDEKVPQLFATIVDGQGKKVSQRMLTRSSAEVTDVVAARVDGGYVLSWVEVDERSSRLLSLRVSDRLVPVGDPRVVSPNVVSPNGVALLTTDRGVVCVWSDARTSGTADLFWTHLDPASGAALGVERRLTERDAHAHSPRLSFGTDGRVVIGWLSDAPGIHGGEFRMGTLDGEGTLSDVRDWRSSGDTRDFSLQCLASECRAVVVVVEGNGSTSRTSLWALRVPIDLAAEAIEAREVLPLWAPGAEGISPSLLGEDVYFADTVPREALWHLRRAKIRWR